MQRSNGVLSTAWNALDIWPLQFSVLLVHQAKCAMLVLVNPSSGSLSTGRNPSADISTFDQRECILFAEKTSDKEGRMTRVNMRIVFLRWQPYEKLESDSELAPLLLDGKNMSVFSSYLCYTKSPPAEKLHQILARVINKLLQFLPV